MADVILDVDYNITKAEANAKKLNAQFEKAKQRLEEQRQKVAETEQKMRQMTEETAKQKAILDSKADITIQEANRYDKMAADTEKITKEYKKQTAQLNVDKANLASIGVKMKESVDKSSALNKRWNIFNRATKETGGNLGRNAKRIKELIKSALFFSVLTKAFTAMREQFGQIIAKDKQMAGYINQIKANMLVIGYQLYDSMKPAIEFILKAVIKITQVLSFILTSVFGKGARSAKSIANSMKKTADEAKKATASFDTLQTADTSQSSSGGNGESGGIDFSGVSNIQQMTVDELTEIATVSGLAMMGLGLILMLTGANIPLGLFLTVTGGLATYKTIKENWNALDQSTKDSLYSIMGIGGILFLAIGVILAFSGAAIPLGIGLMAMGAGMMYGAYRMSNQITPEIRQRVASVMAIGGSLLLLMGLILCFTPALPLGIGMLLAGAGMLYSGIKLSNGSTIREKIRNLANDVKNIFRSVINFIIRGLNKINFSVPDWVPGLGGKKIGFNIKELPMLANGAVIPGGKPFMAMLGDQKAGQTNIEAPLDTIVEAVRIAIGQPNFTIEATGSMAQFIKMLNLKITQEQKRASVF